ncbi:CPBP family glutamic-type intramembrane protease [Leucobacter sp. gxy201]|uniref:CPBP family intramembrane glutamic endopeptidase n=1 Tax=Leucobacter sp. gxy201 TaxID=2957200 RepID=UPI003DA1BD7C
MTQRTVPSRSLPAPVAGMLEAQRPTGIVVGLIITLTAIFVTGALPVLRAIAQGIAFGLGGEQPVFAIEPSTRADLLLSLCSFAFGAALIFIWVRAKERRTVSTLGFTAPCGAKPVAAQALRGAGTALLMITICVFVPVALGGAALAWRAPELDASALGFIALMLGGFLLQGSTEEIVTRGYLTQVVARRWGLTAAVIAQALLFAAIHGANPGMGPMPVINLVLFAVFATMLTLADGSLWGICAFHGVWNWAQGGLYGVAVSGSTVGESLFDYAPEPDSNALLTGGDFGLEGSLVTTVLYTAAAFWAWRTYRRRAQSR